VAANPPAERRTACLLCGGRCDPAHWTCRECHRRMMQEVATELIADAPQSAQEKPCTE